MSRIRPQMELLDAGVIPGDWDAFDLSPWRSPSRDDAGVFGCYVDWGQTTASDLFDLGRELLARKLVLAASVERYIVQVILDRPGAIALAARVRRNHRALADRGAHVRYRESVEELIDEWFEHLGFKPGEAGRE